MRDALLPFAQRRGVTAQPLAIAWTLAQDGVTAAIVGARAPSQVADWSNAVDLVLDHGDLHAIEAAVQHHALSGRDGRRRAGTRDRGRVPSNAVTDIVDDAPATGHVTRELAELLGEEPAHWTAESLVHNRFNAVTAGIWRIRSGSWHAVLKVLTKRPSEDPQWAASEDPTHWNYWCREALVYEHRLPEAWTAGGIGGPRLLGLFRRSDGDIALWLEDVVGVPGRDWSLPQFHAAAHALGVVQGRYLVEGGPPDIAWLSRRFLRCYVDSKRVNWDLLDDNEAWRQPLVRDCFPPRLREAMSRLHAEQEWFLEVAERLPRTFAHLDVWPNNLIAADGGRPVLLDWAFAGDGAVGEDIGNLIPDAVFDLFVPSKALPDLTRVVYESHVAGLRESGWKDDERLVRLGMCASAAKYDWLTPLMLKRAGDERHLDYGSRGAVAAEVRYAERGATLAFLGDWADEARALGPRLGIPGP